MEFYKSSTYENINLYKKQASIENNISKTFVLQNKRGIIYLKMVYGYIRVSTDKQTVENQRFEIERFCKKKD